MDGWREGRRRAGRTWGCALYHDQEQGAWPKTRHPDVAQAALLRVFSRSAAPSPAPPACSECSRESSWAVRRCWPQRAANPLFEQLDQAERWRRLRPAQESLRAPSLDQALEAFVRRKDSRPRDQERPSNAHQGDVVLEPALGDTVHERCITGRAWELS